MPSKMISKLKSLIRDFVPIGRLSYAQEGEDLVLARILGELGITTGFFVDIGAHHPARFSNTYYFYRRGWRGINVDALPGTKRLFQRMRSRDITIECGVGSQEGVLKYFAFNEPALNTFSEQERPPALPHHQYDPDTGSDAETNSGRTFAARHQDRFYDDRCGRL